MFLMKTRPGYGRDQTSELHQLRNNQQGDLLVHRLVQGEARMERGADKGRNIISRADFFSLKCSRGIP